MKNIISFTLLLSLMLFEGEMKTTVKPVDIYYQDVNEYKYRENPENDGRYYHEPCDGLYLHDDSGQYNKQSGSNKKSSKGCLHYDGKYDTIASSEKPNFLFFFFHNVSNGGKFTNSDDGKYRHDYSGEYKQEQNVIGEYRQDDSGKYILDDNKKN